MDIFKYYNWFNFKLQIFWRFKARVCNISMLHWNYNIPFLHQTACTQNLKKIDYSFLTTMFKKKNSANSEFSLIWSLILSRVKSWTRSILLKCNRWLRTYSWCSIHIVSRNIYAKDRHGVYGCPEFCLEYLKRESRKVFHRQWISAFCHWRNINNFQIECR